MGEQKELLETVLNSQRNISIGFVVDGGNRKDLTAEWMFGKGAGESVGEASGFEQVELRGAHIC